MNPFNRFEAWVESFTEEEMESFLHRFVWMPLVYSTGALLATVLLIALLRAEGWIG